MSLFLNEYEPFAAAWLRQLMADGHLPHGVVDARSIADISAAEVVEHRRCHWFAGIAGWELALQLAGWPRERSVWTGSCPCQPYSSAGKRKGNADERDLWPTFARLIRECRPQCVFGEQVSAAIRFGWLDRLCADLEAEGYTVGVCVLGAHSAGADHQRQRLYWVAHLQGEQQGLGFGGSRHGRGELPPDRHCATGGMADADTSAGIAEQEQQHGEQPNLVGRSGLAVWDHWRDAITIECRDGKRRRVPAEPALFPLASGLPNRVGLLRGAGNAICVQTAAMFVRAFLEAETEQEAERSAARAA